jgi:hypothetical protein
MSQYNQEKELLINITKPNIQDDDTKLMLRSGGNSKRNPLPFHKRIERFRLWFKDFLEKYELDKLMVRSSRSARVQISQLTYSWIGLSTDTQFH